MVKDSERTWLVTKKAISMTATALARGSGISKYDRKAVLFAKRLFDPGHKLLGNAHMARGVACEPAILEEFFVAIGAAHGIDSNLMSASWDVKSGATPDAGGIVVRRDQEGRVRHCFINVEAKAPMFAPSVPPALYLAQMHQQCATMGVTESYLVMSDTRGKRVSFKLSFSPAFHHWCYRRMRQFQCHLDMEEKPYAFTAMHMQPHVDKAMQSQFESEGFVMGLQRRETLPPRRTVDASRAMTDTSRAVAEEGNGDRGPFYMPPAIRGITAPAPCCYRRSLSVGKAAIAAGLLDKEF